MGSEARVCGKSQKTKKQWVSVYIRWPTEDGGNWHYLGFICNQKPSAIFKVAQVANLRNANPSLSHFQLHKSDASHSGVFGMQMQLYSSGSAQIGINAENLSIIEGRQAAEGTQASQQVGLSTSLINHSSCCSRHWWSLRRRWYAISSTTQNRSQSAYRIPPAVGYSAATQSDLSAYRLPGVHPGHCVPVLVQLVHSSLPIQSLLLESTQQLVMFSQWGI